MVVHGRPKTPKNRRFMGSPSPQGSHNPYILGYTTRPGRVTHVLVWSKSDRRRLRKTKLCTNKQTNRQTNRQTDTTKIMVTWPWTNISNNGPIQNVPQNGIGLNGLCKWKKCHHILKPITTPYNVDRFSKFFRLQTQSLSIQYVTGLVQVHCMYIFGGSCP